MELYKHINIIAYCLLHILQALMEMDMKKKDESVQAKEWLEQHMGEESCRFAST